jgi:predicted metal-dependent TIM-barrel fold hydrolase
MEVITMNNEINYIFKRLNNNEKAIDYVYKKSMTECARCNIHGLIVTCCVGFLGMCYISSLEKKVAKLEQEIEVMKSEGE